MIGDGARRSWVSIMDDKAELPAKGLLVQREMNTAAPRLTAIGASHKVTSPAMIPAISNEPTSVQYETCLLNFVGLNKKCCL